MLAKTQAESKPDDFFPISRFGCLLFLFLLATMVLGTGAQLVSRLVQPTTTLTGTISQVEETRSSNRQVTYGITLHTADEVLFIRLRNNGRILSYLQELAAGRRARISRRNGEAIAVQLLDPSGPLIRENELPPIVPAAVGLLGLILLVPLGAPGLVEGRLLAADTPGKRVGSTEDEEG